jgi:hypothetical protein
MYACVLMIKKIAKGADFMRVHLYAPLPSCVCECCADELLTKRGRVQLIQNISQSGVRVVYALAVGCNYLSFIKDVS